MNKYRNMQFPPAARLVALAKEQEISEATVIEIVRKTTPRLGCKDEAYAELALHRRFAEVAFEERFRKVALQIPDLVELIDIPDGYETKRFRFEKQYGTTLVKWRENGDLVTDIDGLVAIAECKEGSKVWHPYLIEVKMGKQKYVRIDHYVTLNGKTYYIKDQKFKPRNQVSKLIANPHKVNGIDPVLEYFQDLYEKEQIDHRPEQVGLIIGIPGDDVDGIAKEAQKRCQDMGCHIMKFPDSLVEYVYRISTLPERYDFKIA